MRTYLLSFVVAAAALQARLQQFSRARARDCRDIKGRQGGQGTIIAEVVVPLPKQHILLDTGLAADMLAAGARPGRQRAVHRERQVKARQGIGA